MLTEELDARCDFDLSLVMPRYNEEATVSHTISGPFGAFTKAGYRLEIVTVDNGSMGRTGKILRRLAASNPAVLYHRVEVNRGYGKVRGRRGPTL
jgi:glycosyltransferase involved in cell wall biosynthesis